MPEIIIRPKRPFLVFGGSMPSQSGGRRVEVLASVDQDGKWSVEKEDMGPELGRDEPILFLPFGGSTYALSRDDLKEVLAGMRESHQRWRDNQPKVDWTARVKEFASIALSRQKGRKQFYYEKGIPDGNEG